MKLLISYEDMTFINGMSCKKLLLEYSPTQLQISAKSVLNLVLLKTFKNSSQIVFHREVFQKSKLNKNN
jgi:hypothetical protein